MTSRPSINPSRRIINNEEEKDNSYKENNNISYDNQENEIDQSIRYQELKKKQILIQKERTKREVEYEHIKYQLNICEEEAKSLGVETIEELKELIKKKEEEEKSILDAFEESLLKEEEALNEIENNLNN